MIDRKESMTNVTLLPGVAGIKQAYNQALEANRIDIQCLAKDYQGVIGDFFDLKVAPVLEKKQVRETVQPVRDNLQSETDIMITDEAVYLVSFAKDNPFALVLKEQGLVKAMQNLFERGEK